MVSHQIVTLTHLAAQIFRSAPQQLPSTFWRGLFAIRTGAQMESGSGIGPENLLDLYMVIISRPLRTETQTFPQRQQVVQEALTPVSQGRWSFISCFF